MTSATMSPPRTIEPQHITLLTTHRDHRILHGRAKLQAIGDRFVMEGPSGKHSLAIVATDAARLNAHWQNFAADPRNAA